MLKTVLLKVAIVIVFTPISESVTRNDFTFVRSLESGRSGYICVVQKKDNGRFYVMKSMYIRPDGLNTPKYVNYERKMMEEMNAYDWAVHMHFAFFENPMAYIVMDYVSQGSLYSKLEQGYMNMTDINGRWAHVPISHEHTLEIIPHVLSLINKVHRAGYVHRDFGAKNILVTRRGTLLAADFADIRRIGYRKLSWKIWEFFQPLSTRKDYENIADEWTGFTHMLISYNNILYAIDKTDCKTINRLRSHESFRNAGINWNAVDRGEEPFRAPFEAQEFVLPTPLPNDYPRYTDYEVMAPLTPKVQAAFRNFYYESPNGNNPRDL